MFVRDALFKGWPHDRSEYLARHPLPVPSDVEIEAIKQETVALHDSDAPGPLARAWLDRLANWHRDLVADIGRPEQVAGKFFASLPEWRRRLAHLPPARSDRLLRIISGGFVLPFLSSVDPDAKAWDCRSNPPGIEGRMRDRVWAVVEKTMKIGAIHLWDVDALGLPRFISPVFAVDEGSKIRLVHNLKRLNKLLDPSTFSTTLETLSSVRNMFRKGRFLTCMDMSSAYMHVPIAKRHHTFMSFGLNASEIPPDKLAALVANHPNSKHGSRFLFYYSTLSFGLGPAAAVFCDFSTACAMVWRRCPVPHSPGLSLTSYVDDWAFVNTFKGGIYTSCRILMETALLGWTINVVKSKWLPRSRQVHLGMFVNLRDFTVSVTPKRAAKLCCRLLELRREVGAAPDSEGVRWVKARTVARWLGTLWSISLVAPRAVAVMGRRLSNMLAGAMRVSVSDFSLRSLLRTFWGGVVAWDPAAGPDVEFWSPVDWLSLRSSISYDLTRDAILQSVARDFVGLADGVVVLGQDASAHASGMGRYVVKDNELVEAGESLTFFNEVESGFSSTWRELQGCMWALQSLAGRHDCKIIMPCDNTSTVKCIRRGSPVVALNVIAVEIFRFCLERNICLVPVWTRRDTRLIVIWDARGRIHENEFATPALVFFAASDVAVKLWGRTFSFDRAASWRNVMPPGPGLKLPFCSRWPQPGSSGDLFNSSSWAAHVNWCHAPFAIMGRLLNFLPSTLSRVAVIVPVAQSFAWTPLALPGACGVRHRLVYRPSCPEFSLHGRLTNSFRGSYAVVFFDFRGASSPGRQRV